VRALHGAGRWHAEQGGELPQRYLFDLSLRRREESDAYAQERHRIAHHRLKTRRIAIAATRDVHQRFVATSSGMRRICGFGADASGVSDVSIAGALATA